MASSLPTSIPMSCRRLRVVMPEDLVSRSAIVYLVEQPDGWGALIS